MIPVIEERADELKRLCLQYGVRRLDLFGSAATARTIRKRATWTSWSSFSLRLSTPMRTPTSACWKLSDGFSDGPWTW